jgi:hypothetical protein
MKIDRKYLPSRNFVIALVIAILIVVFSIFFIQKNKIKQGEITTKENSVNEEVWVDQTDTDGDGLLDWQETLYGTDKNKIDTDSDGTNDSQETKDGRNPLKANTSKTSTPNDMVEVILPEENKIDTYIPTTKTEAFSINLLSDITASEDEYGNLTDGQVKYIAENAIKNIDKLGEKYQGTTKLTDLNFVDVNNKNILNYIDFYYAETEKIRSLINTDMILINENNSKQTPDNIKTLENIILKYKTIINNFTKTPLPGGSVWATTYHLAIINQLEKLVLIDKDLMNFDKDPIKYAPAITAYTKENIVLLSVLTIMDRIFLIERI